MARKMNPELKVGDRVVLINMEGEEAIPFGMTGTVIGMSKPFDLVQYQVDWDNGSKLDILSDTDTWVLETSK